MDHAPPLNLDKFNAKLDKLKQAWIHNTSIFTEADISDFMSLVCNLCTQAPDPVPSVVYEAFKDFLKEYLSGRLISRLTQNSTADTVLSDLYSLWNHYEERVSAVRELFGYLDLFPDLAGSLHDARHIVFVNTVIEIDLLKACVLNMVRQYRDGVLVDKNSLKSVCELLDGNEINAFHETVLHETEVYYSSKASIWILEDLKDYMPKVELRLKWEESETIFPIITKRNLLKIVQTELLFKHSSRLLEDEKYGYVALLRENKEEHLVRMYRIYSDQHKAPVSAAPTFKLHATDVGTNVFNPEQHCLCDKEVIVGHFASHLECVQTFAIGFQKYSFFDKVLHNALKGLRQDAEGILSEQWLATFYSDLLENGGRDDHIEELEKVLKIIEFTGDKDLFLKFYRQTLAKRLLFSKNVNDQHERMSLAKLKQVFGGPFTAKMEQMVEDLALSREVELRIREFLQMDPDINPGINLTVNALAKHSWAGFSPFDVNPHLRLPMEIVKCHEAYMKYYRKIMPRRKLTWINSLGMCTLRGIFEDSTTELVVTTCQASVLLLFNATTRLSYAGILSSLNLKPDVVISLLNSLSCKEFQLLNKVPVSDTISLTDSFEFNSKFTCPMGRIKVPLGCLETDQVDCMPERTDIINACIMGVMEENDHLSLNRLLGKCAAFLSNTVRLEVEVESKEMENRVADLLSQQYLEWDEDGQVLRYNAR